MQPELVVFAFAILALERVIADENAIEFGKAEVGNGSRALATGIDQCAEGLLCSVQSKGKGTGAVAYGAIIAEGDDVEAASLVERQETQD